MNAWKVILATLVIFGAGVVTGGLAIRISQSHKPKPAPVNPNNPTTPWQFNRPDFLPRAERMLDLTPEQRALIEAIIRQSQERMEPVWREVKPKMIEELHRVRDEIHAVLTPEQRDKFEELVRQRPFRKPDEPPMERRPRDFRRPQTNDPSGEPGFPPRRPPPPENP